MRKVLVALVFIGGCTAVASTLGPLSVTWDPPTQRVNGTALDPETEIAKHTVYCREQGSSEWPSEGYDIEGGSTEGYHEVSREELLEDYGTYECTITTTDTDGRESDYGGTDTVVWKARPDAPANFKIGVR